MYFLTRKISYSQIFMCDRISKGVTCHKKPPVRNPLNFPNETRELEPLVNDHFSEVSATTFSADCFFSHYLLISDHLTSGVISLFAAFTSSLRVILGTVSDNIEIHIL